MGDVASPEVVVPVVVVGGAVPGVVVVPAGVRGVVGGGVSSLYRSRCSLNVRYVSIHTSALTSTCGLRLTSGC